MKRLVILFLLLNLSACSVEEHNRKALAQKQTNLEAFQADLLQDPAAEVTEFATYTQINLKNEQWDYRGGGAFTQDTTGPKLRTTEYYFVKKSHIAYPTVVIREQSERGEDSWWTWQSTAERKVFNQWFEQELWFTKFPQDEVYSCSLQVKNKNICGSFKQNEIDKLPVKDELAYSVVGRLTRQSAVTDLIRFYNKCRCKPNNESKRHQL